MTDRPTVLIAGYGSWCRAADNPAAAVAERLAGTGIDGCRLVARPIAVDSAALEATVEDWLASERPQVWLGIGVAVGRPFIAMESVAINRCHFGVPDATGARRLNDVVEADGPSAIDATLPNAAIVAAQRAAGIPAQVSFHAGTHLCNQMLYTVPRVAQRFGLRLRQGFMHVPQSTANAALEDDPHAVPPSMEIDSMVRAARIAVACCLDG